MPCIMKSGLPITFMAEGLKASGCTEVINVFIVCVADTKLMQVDQRGPLLSVATVSQHTSFHPFHCG